jgi:hypothetical protein
MRLPRLDTQLSALEHRVRQLALHRHELGIKLPTNGCWTVQKMFLDPVELVWWVNALDALGNDLHAIGWCTALHPGHDYVSLRVWHPDHDSDSDSDSESDEPAFAEPGDPLAP